MRISTISLTAAAMTVSFGAAYVMIYTSVVAGLAIYAAGSGAVIAALYAFGANR